jgi:hypothetical protein
MLSSLAELPEQIEQCFYTKQVNAAGCYVVYFYINGIKTPVMIDDWLPVVSDGRPAFASSKNDELWVCLLEKAWAKLHKSFARVEGGVPYFAFSQLCGLPGYSQNHEELLGDAEKIDEFWKELIKFDRRNFVLLAASHGEGENNNDLGIISGHAYSVIKIIEFNHNGK